MHISLLISADLQYTLERIAAGVEFCENGYDIAVSFALSSGAQRDSRRRSGNAFFREYLQPLDYTMETPFNDRAKRIRLLQPRDHLAGEERNFAFIVDAQAAQWEAKQRRSEPCSSRWLLFELAFHMSTFSFLFLLMLPHVTLPWTVLRLSP